MSNELPLDIVNIEERLKIADKEIQEVLNIIPELISVVHNNQNPASLVQHLDNNTREQLNNAQRELLFARKLIRRIPKTWIQKASLSSSSGMA